MQRPAGGGRKETVIHHRPLIGMLITAATTKGGSSGTASSAGGMVLNAIAFQKIEDLKKQIRSSWCSLLPGADLLINSFRYGPAESLHLWHATFTTTTSLRRITGSPVAAAMIRYTGWADLIDLMFDPQPVSEFMGACPGCAAEYLLTIDDERVRAITISFKTIIATCRNCGEVWSGPADFVRLKNDRTPPRHAADDRKIA